MSADPRMGVLESCRGKVDGSSGIRAVRNRGNLAARARVFTAIQHEASQRVHVVDEGSASESACSSPDVISGSYYDNEEIQEQSLEDSIAEAEALLESMALNGRILNGNENQDRVEDVNNDIVDGIFPKYSMESEDSLLEPLPTSSSVEICAATQRLAVVLRKRPLISSERSAGESDIVKVDPKTQKVILSVEKKQWDGGKFNEHTSFVFDQVYDEKSSNAAIYRTSVRPLVDDFLEGGHPSCFVYGATASGKSYTMFGTPRREGIVWLAARDIFSRKAANVSVFLSFFEIHLNRLSDLLHQKSRVRMVEDANGTFKFLGLKEIPCLSLDELMSNVREGNLLRTTSANKRNRLSSRGHAVVQMNAVDSEGNRVGRISFVDLAGSERGCDINPRNKALL